ncbi:MAG: carbon-nitrogen hydrolase family protein [SAR202 cluster bacterium]|nr:carbon-nitrogen hydrolase family protein [SAR202 cluster bacterium]
MVLMIQYPSYKAAAAHVSPVFMDVAATVDKACSMIREAAGNGAQLVVFPETYIPAFPLWCALQAPIYNHDLFRALAANTIRVPGPELDMLANTAREAGVFVSMGFNEGTDASVGNIWNSNVLIGDDGAILNHHRKIVPTFYEKLVWARGDGAGLQVSSTKIGRLGMLICGENTNPLARYTLMAQGEQVHMSTYPPTWPTHDQVPSDNYDLEQAIQIRAAVHSFEAKAFNIVAAGFLDKVTRDLLAARDPDAGRILDCSPRGVSVVMGPHGKPVSEVMKESEGLLYADIDLSACVEPKQYHDVVGGYNRFDIFKLTVDRTAHRPVHFEATGAENDTLAEEGHRS